MDELFPQLKQIFQKAYQDVDRETQAERKRNPVKKKKYTYNNPFMISPNNMPVANPQDVSENLQRLWKIRLLTGMVLEELDRDYKNDPYKPDPQNDPFSRMTGYSPHVLNQMNIVPTADTDDPEQQLKKLKMERKASVVYDDKVTIHSIPIDVLRYIFSFMLLPSNFHPRTWEGILLACKRWHNIAIELLHDWNTYLLNFDEIFFDGTVTLDTWDPEIERKRRQHEFLIKRRQSLDSFFGEQFMRDCNEEERNLQEEESAKRKLATIEMYDVVSFGSAEAKDTQNPVNWRWRKDAQPIAFGMVKMPIWKGTGKYTFTIEVINPSAVENQNFHNSAVEVVVGLVNGSAISFFDEETVIFADLQKNSIYLSPKDARSRNESERTIGYLLSKGNINWLARGAQTSSADFQFEVDTGSKKFWASQRELEDSLDPELLPLLEPKKGRKKAEVLKLKSIDSKKIPQSALWKMTKESLKKFAELGGLYARNIQRLPKPTSLANIFQGMGNGFPKLAFVNQGQAIPLNPSEDSWHIICGFVFPPELKEPNLAKIHLMKLEHEKSTW